MKEVFLNPFTDFGFKKLFGEEDSKEYLIDFLNSVFAGYIPFIQELNYGKNEHLGSTELDRNAVFDLYCKNGKGERFIIELQKASQRFFRERTLFYSTFAIQEQAEKGNDWNFKIDPIYCIGILNFKFHHDEEKYFHFGKILDTQTKEVLIDNINFAYIECPKFNKQISKDSSNHDKWLYVLSNLYKLEALPPELQSKIFERFFTKANVVKLNVEEKAKYNNSIKYYRDMHNVVEFAEYRGLQKGIEQGIEQGLQQGIEKGLQQGIQEGQLKTKIELAKKMLARNIPIQYIAEDTGLSIEQIQNLS